VEIEGNFSLMWIIDRVKNDKGSHNQARCHGCGYAFNIDIFTQKDVALIMEAHSCKGGINE
jgi:hypothetical protein